MPKKTIKEKAKDTKAKVKVSKNNIKTTVKDTMDGKNTSRTLAKYQIGLAIVSLILVFVSRLLINADSGVKTDSFWSLTFKTSWGILRILNLGVWLVGLLIIGIFQLVQGAQRSEGIIIASGIISILAFIPWLPFVVLILNVVILAKKN